MPQDGGMSEGVTWASVASVGLAAAITIAAADVALQRICPLLPDRLEVSSGLAAVEAGDPDVLVLGSSHARAFSVIRERLAETGIALVQLPVEWGKHSSYRWVVNHKLLPLLDEHGPSGERLRTRLRQLIYVTEWWDGCAPPPRAGLNVPSRAWTFRDFAEDAAQHGLDPYNHAYLDRRWNRLLHGSLLVQDRGVHRLPTALLDRLGLRSAARAEAERAGQLEYWHEMVEGAFTDPLCQDGTELQAMRDVIRTFRSRGVEVTVILFPRMPSTLTAKALGTTFPRYARAVRAAAAEAGAARVLDMTTVTPLGDEHFMSDFDHTTAEGNRILADFWLAGELAFLRRIRPTSPSATAQVREGSR